MIKKLICLRLLIITAFNYSTVLVINDYISVVNYEIIRQDEYYIQNNEIILE